MDTPKNVAFRLDRSLYNEFRFRLLQRSQTLQAALVEAVRLWLEQHQPEDDDATRRRIASVKGAFGRLQPERVLSEELIADRRREASLE